MSLASSLGRRLGAVALGLAIERVVPEPPTRWHPVAWFGTAMGHVERRLWADARGRGVAYAATGVAIGTLAGAVVPLPIALVLSVAGRQLRTVGTEIGASAAAGDLEAARARLPWLVGRDPSGLDADGIAAAVVESVAENHVDAVVAPAWWAVIGGAPGVFAHRAVNTMDAMVGHRSPRHRHFGTAAARLDDVANYVPARIFAGLVAGLVAATGRAPIAATWCSALADGRRHPSPNAGVAEAVVARSLGIELGGPLRYGDRTERRPVLGSGRRATPADVPAAVALCSRAQLALSLAAGIGWLLLRPRSRRP